MTERRSESAEWPDEEAEVEPGEPGEPSVETPLEDAVEQSREAVSAPSDVRQAGQVPPDVDPADLADQTREVPYDDEEYR